MIQSVQSRLRRTYDAMRIWHVVAIAMIVTGLLYPSARFSMQQGIITLLGDFGFHLWCASLVFCGGAIFVYSQWLPLWLLPLHVLGISQAIFAFFRDNDHILPSQDGALTAPIYYSLLVLVTVYLWYIETYPNRVKLANKLFPSQMMGILHVLMALVLLGEPNGSGLDLLYGTIDRFLLGAFEPALIYQLLYLITGIVLLYPIDYGYRARQLLYIPFISHGITFSFIGISVYGIFTFVPLFLAITVLLFKLAGVNHD